MKLGGGGGIMHTQGPSHLVMSVIVYRIHEKITVNYMLGIALQPTSLHVSFYSRNKKGPGL